MQPPVYRVETPRTTLRCWSPEDAALVKAAEDESREHLRHYMLWAERGPESMTEVSDKLRLFRSWFDTGEDFMFGAFAKDGGPARCIGGAGLHPRVGEGGLEIGYWIHVDHVRQGIATEIAGALTRVAFEVARVRWLEIRCASSNEPSAGIPKRLGFSHEATLKERIIRPNGAIESSLIFTMLAREYPTSEARRIATEGFDGSGRKVL